MPKTYTKWSERKKKRTRRHNLKWTPEAVARLRQLSKVATEKEIAAEMGCSVKAVGNRKHALKVEAQETTGSNEHIARMVHLSERISLCKAYLKRNPLPSKSGLQS